MEERRLPQHIRAKASVSPGGEYAWSIDDVEEVVLAAREAGVACLGGQPQFQLPDAVCEAYWLNYQSSPRRETEAWEDYVERSAREVLEALRRVRRSTDFTAEARQWDVVRKKIESAGTDPLQFLRFVLYFESEARQA